MKSRVVVLAALLASLAVTPAGAASLRLDYPAEGAVFPPDFSPPTFLWHDDSPAASWKIEATFASGPPLRIVTAGQRARVGEIDPDCISTTNRLPEADPKQRTWKPSASLWDQIRQRSVDAPVTLNWTGLAAGRAVSSASVHIRISSDPVGAPIFYRDVPLMPTETEKGVIKPLAPYAVRLVQWRLRYVAEPRSRVVMRGLPMCANCHSFSAGGTRLGMDLDGLRGNRGRYFLADVKPQTSVREQDVIQWASAQGTLQSPVRVGFMSQVSPDGNTVVTAIDTPGSRSSNYYVANFTDYRFLQVFFPTRGLLAWYNRDSGVLTPLPGADDPAYVHFGAVWDPRGEYLVFARARAQDPNPPGRPPAGYANDPGELQIQYDLCRIPFRGGRGGTAEPIAGASANGMSNTFPKLSPDGRWLVYVQSRNGQLMRPDSQLYIVPAAGGVARRMHCNTRLMNSWHSFSPNGRWLVFSSKARSPYTQMYLTHIDPDGNDTPPVLIEDSTAANRAVNLPEFVNLPPGGLESIGGPALDYYRLFDRALYLQKERRYTESAGKWKELLAIAPGDAEARRRLGMVLLLAGRRSEALPYLEKHAPSETALSRAIRLLEAGQDADPAPVAASPNGQEHYYLALVSLKKGDREIALTHLRETLRLGPNNVGALRRAAWILATDPRLHDGAAALDLAVRAAMLTRSEDTDTLAALAAAYAEKGRYEDAEATARRALAGAGAARQPLLERQLDRYRARQPWRE
jgi:tetratricopeptide (TPR) repeat protein